MGRSRARSGYATVSIPVDEVLSEISDEALKEEYVDRFGALPQTERDRHDVIAEAYAEIVAGRVPSGLAILDAELAAARVKDEHRQAQYQAAGRA